MKQKKFFFYLINFTEKKKSIWFFKKKDGTLYPAKQAPDEIQKVRMFNRYSIQTYFKRESLLSVF